MPDREKLIHDIERCICRVPDACRDCSHYQDGRLDCKEKLLFMLADSLDLLKEQGVVVRCRDCTHYKWLIEACDHVGGSVAPDWFCADGEEKHK